MGDRRQFPRHRRAGPGLAIDIADVTVIAAEGDTVVVRFVETHRWSHGATRRRVMAVLVDDVSAAQGLRWLCVHETDAAVEC